jgi:hypothetical protein
MYLAHKDSNSDIAAAAGSCRHAAGNKVRYGVSFGAGDIKFPGEDSNLNKVCAGTILLAGYTHLLYLLYLLHSVGRCQLPDSAETMGAE